jgi:hypothetical protein
LGSAVGKRHSPMTTRSGTSTLLQLSLR